MSSSPSTSLVRVPTPSSRSAASPSPSRSTVRPNANGNAEPLSSRTSPSPRNGALVVASAASREVVAAPAAGGGELDVFPSSFSKSARDKFQRPTSANEYSLTFTRRFTTNTSTPARTKSDFTGTNVVQKIAPPQKTDIKCAELVDGNQVWIGNKDGSISVLDRQSGEEVYRSPQREAICCCMLEVADTVWCGFSDGFVRVLDKSSRAVKINLSRHTGPVTALTAQVGGHFVFSASLDFTVLQWDANTYAYAGRFLGPSCGVRSLAVSFERLYTGCDDGVVRVWDIYDKTSQEWRGHVGGVQHLLVVDGSLWSGSEDGTIRVWNRAGKCVEVLQSPARQPVTMLTHVGSTVWSSTVGQISIWDAVSRALLQEMREHDTYVTAACVTAVSLVSRLWTLSASGEIVVFNTESELRGDDNALAEEIRRRGDEVVFLRDAMRDLQEQAVDLQNQANDRVQRIQYTLQKTREESEARACQIADLRAQLDAARSEIAKRDDMLAAKDIRAANETEAKSVRRVMANHLQATERRLMEAEAKVQKLQAELHKETLLNERRSNRDVEDTREQGRTLGMLQATELRSKELDRRLEEANQERAALELHIQRLRDENVELAAKLEMSRLKIDEAQKLVALHASQAKASQKEKASLQAMQRTLSEAHLASAPGSPTSPKTASAGAAGGSSAAAVSRQGQDGAGTDSAAKKKKSALMPILPVKPQVDRIFNYVRTVCAAESSFEELPEVMQQALRLEVVRTKDRSIDDVPSARADEYAQRMLVDSEAQRHLRDCLSEGVDSLTPQQQFGLLLGTLRLYCEDWPAMTRRQQLEWYDEHAIFPPAIQFVRDVERTVSTLSTIGPKRRERAELALKRIEYIRTNAAAVHAPEYELSEQAQRSVPPPVVLRINRELQSGWKRLAYPYRRALLLAQASQFFNDWHLMRAVEQRAAFAKAFPLPSLDDVHQEVKRLFEAKDLPESAVALLKAVKMMATQPALVDMPLLRLLDHGRMRSTPEIDNAINNQVAMAQPGSLTRDQLAALSIDFVAQFTDSMDALNFATCAKYIERTAKKIVVDADEVDPTQSRSEVVAASIASRVTDWDAMAKVDRIEWLRANCIFPPLLDLQQKVARGWPPVDTKLLALAICRARRKDPRTESATVMKQLNQPWDRLAPEEHQIILREIFFNHVPRLEADDRERETFMQAVGQYPRFAEALPTLKQIASAGFTALPPHFRTYLIVSCMPDSDLPMQARTELANTFSHQYVENLQATLSGPFDSISDRCVDAMHRALMCSFVADWSKLSEADQTRWMRARRLLQGGDAATLSVLVAQGEMTGTPMTATKLVIDASQPLNSAPKQTPTLIQQPQQPAPPQQVKVELDPTVTVEPASPVQQKPAAPFGTTGFVLRLERGIQVSPFDFMPDASSPPSAPLVQPETLFDVARKYNIGLNELMEANPHIRSPTDPLDPGQRVVIPRSVVAITESPSEQKRQSLNDIANEAAIPLQVLQAANKHIIDPYAELPLNSRVYLPPREHSSPPASPVSPPPSPAVTYNQQQQQPGSPSIVYQQQQQPGVVYQQQAAAQPQQPTLSDIARQVGVSVDDLMRANPSVRSPYEPLAPGQQITLPPSGRSETVQQVAQRSNVTVEEVLRANPQYRSATDVVQPTQRLVVPAPAPSIAYQQQQPGSPSIVYQQQQQPGVVYQQQGRAVVREQVIYRAEKEEHIAEVSRRTGVPVEVIRQQNPQLRADVLHPGVVLRLPVDVLDKAQNSSSIRNAGDFRSGFTYVSRDGDTLHAVGVRYGVDDGALRALNPGVAPHATIAPGTTIYVPSPEELRRRDVPIMHEVQQGDTIHTIAHRYGIAPEVVARQVPSARGFYDPLPAGQQVVIQQGASSGGRREHVLQRGETIHSVAALYGTTHDDVLAHNPHLRYQPITAGTTFVVPPPSAKPGWGGPEGEATGFVHVVREGETLQSIAFRYGVSEDDLKRHNPFLRQSTAPIPAGRKVIVTAPSTASYKPSVVSYDAAEGESVAAIAARYGVTVDDIRRANPHVQHDVVRTPQSISIPAPQPVQWSAFGRVVRMRSLEGDTVETLSHRHGITVDELLYANPTLPTSGYIAPGTQVTVIEGSTSTQASRSTGGAAMTYVVQPGDTEQSIARRYGVNLADLRRLNPSASFAPFQPIVLPMSTNNVNYVRVATNANDTPQSVAMRYGVTTQELIAANPHIADHSPTSVLQRQELTIPKGRGAALNDLQRGHFVETNSGDTLAAIALRHNIPIEELRAANPVVNSADDTLPFRHRIAIPPRFAAAASYSSTLNDDDIQRMERVDVYEARDGETVSAIAARHGLSEEDLRVVNPHLGAYCKGRQTIVVPRRDPEDPDDATESRNADDHGTSAGGAARRLDHTATSREAQELALEYEEIIEALRNENADQTLLRRRLGDLMRKQTQLTMKLDEYAAVNQEWEAKYKALERASEFGSDPSEIKAHCVKLMTQLHHARADYANKERALKNDLERELARKIRTLERQRREEVERLRGQFEHLAESEGSSRALVEHSAPAGSHSGSSSGALSGTIPEEVLPFLRYKDDQYALLLRRSTALEDDNAVLVAKCTEMSARLEEARFAVDSRPDLLRILYDLQRAAQLGSKSLTDLIARVNIREHTRKQLTDELESLLRQVRDIVNGHKWIIGNLFTEVEIHHIGSSPSHYLEVTRQQTTMTAVTTTTTMRVARAAASSGAASPITAARTTSSVMVSPTSRVASTGTPTRRADSPSSVNRALSLRGPSASQARPSSPARR